MCNLWWTKWHWNKFSSSISVFPCQYYFTNAPYSFSFMYFSYPKDKRAKPGKFSKGKYPLVSLGALGRRVLSLFLNRLLLHREIIAVFLRSVQQTQIHSVGGTYNL